MIFVDSNIPMYLVGADHPNKGKTAGLLERLIREEKRFVTDAEVLQEILHRYKAINRLDAVLPALNALLGIVDEIFPIESVDVLRAKDILLEYSTVSSRDALHIAIMLRYQVEELVSFDSGFDHFPWVKRWG